ncbi:hypothetical protein [Marimonas arenosa]|uniref:Uncharacterized protein n=1 Tax=Marimonas arenosa TaxID=1795305 RepID=A0AAE4B426_9RHOB|nr:hypothetical protein [Marimonas arenosa]MDQ2089795.1 hypothetical protein [Marimonas arenosa]
MSDKLLKQLASEEFRVFVKTVLDRKAARGKEAITARAAEAVVSGKSATIRVSIDHALLTQLRELTSELRDEIEPKLGSTLRKLKAAGTKVFDAGASGSKAAARRAELAKAAETPEAWAAYWDRPMIDPITGGCIVACIVVCGMIIVWIVVEECFPAPAPPPTPTPPPPPEEECVEVEVPVETEVCEEECEEQCPDD